MVLDRFRSWLTGLVRATDRDPEDDGTALFESRYHSLRLLLAANNKALDTIDRKSVV